MIRFTMTQDACDVLVLGDDVAALAAAILLRNGSAARVICIGRTEPPARERLVLLNPAAFSLDKGIADPGVSATPVHTVRFCSDDASVRQEHRFPALASQVVHLQELTTGLREVAARCGVTFARESSVRVLRIDENEMEVAASDGRLRCRMVLLSDDQLVDPSGIEIRARGTQTSRGLTYAFCHNHNRRSPGVLPLSVDLQGQLRWGWLLTHGQLSQVLVDHEPDHPDPVGLLRHWLGVLNSHGEQVDDPGWEPRTIQLPAGEALRRETVGPRTLRIGIAGGFVSACCEEAYPGIWSGVCAANVASKALRERFLQDALQPFRSEWGGTLGDYLRGPHENLRFLLPLVYRNPTMAARLAEAILLGASVVR
jgi:flavin-dependent dehydrogenase